MSSSLKSFHMPKEVWGYAKKRETLKLSKQQKNKKNGTHEDSKVLKEKKMAHTSKTIIKERESHDQ